MTVCPPSSKNEPRTRSTMSDERKAFAFNLDAQSMPLIEFSDAAKSQARDHRVANKAIHDSDFEAVASEYLTWRQSLPSGFGLFLRSRLRTLLLHRRDEPASAVEVDA